MGKDMALPIRCQWKRCLVRVALAIDVAALSVGMRSRLVVPVVSVVSVVSVVLALAAVRIGAQSAAPSPPQIQREFRAVWVATVANIDWPSKPGLSTWDQQRELLAILDRVASLHLNAVVLQVRPGADAFFSSPYEPWSQFLTGRQGRAPRATVGPARLRDRARTRARARAARLVQSLSRGVHARLAAMRGRTSLALTRGWFARTIATSGWTRRPGGAAAARSARSSTSRSDTTSTVCTSTTTSIRIRRTTRRESRSTFRFSDVRALSQRRRYARERRLRRGERRQARGGVCTGAFTP